MNKRKYKNYLWGYFFVAPTIIGLLILNIYPIFKTLLLSFSTSTGFEEYVFSGLNNFTRVLKDREVWIGLRNTLIFSAVSVPGGIFISLLLAWLMSKEIRGRSVYRVIYFTPMVAAPAAVTMVWAWLYNSEFGFLNYVIKSLGGATHSWLHDPKYALMSVIIIAIWGGLGQQIIILIVAITNVPRVYYEAAEIDGTNKWQTYFMIYLPNSKAILATLGLLKGVAVWNDYLWPLIMTNSENMKTVQLALTMFKTDGYIQWGQMMAASVLVVMPMILLFLCAQKYFVQGIVTSGLK